MFLLFCVFIQSSKENYDHRPRYHFTAPKNWLNDPNGLIFYKNNYHLFYQHNPKESKWGNIVWGHAISKDLVNWEHLPIAISIDESEYDKAGIWSGNIVIYQEKAYAFYTGVTQRNESFPFKEVQCLAISEDDKLIHWKKFDKNPVIEKVPFREYEGMRDPVVWKTNENRWLMSVGIGFKGIGGNVLLYESNNLKNWRFIDKILSDEDSRRVNQTGKMWECPIFLFFQNKAVLILGGDWDFIDPKFTQYYIIGEWKNERFIPRKVEYLDHGYIYAANSFQRTNEHIVIGWIREGITIREQEEQGWSGAQSIPFKLDLVNDNIKIKPIPELIKLRKKEYIYDNIIVDNQWLKLDYSGKYFEIKAKIDINYWEDLQDFGFIFRASEDLRELTVINISPKKKILTIKRNISSIKMGDKFDQNVAFKGDELRLHIFVDNSIIEIFINENIRLSSRIYPILNSELLYLYSQATIKFKELKIWDLF